MTWFKLAGEGAFHEKVIEAGNEPYGAWCRAGQWSCQHLTDGRIPRAVALTIAPTEIWDRLVAAKGRSAHGLAESVDGGWQIHDFLEWNPSAAEELAKREADKARKAAGRKSQGRGADGRVTSSRNPSGHQPESKKSPPVPYPIPYPDPEEKDLDPSVCVSPPARTREEQDPIPRTRRGADLPSLDLPPLPDAEWLAAEFRRYPAVERFAADENLVADIAGGLQAKPHTIERAREIVADFVTKSGLEARSMDRAEFQRRFGGYVTSARLRGTKIALVPQSAPRAPPVLSVAFARGHEAYGSAGYPVPTEPRDEAALVSVVAARCPTLTSEAAGDWIAHAVKRFLRARASDPDSKFWKGGDGVQGFVSWIGAEKKADAERAEVLRLAAAVPKMTDDELLEYDRKQREARRNAAPTKPDTPTVRRVAPNFPNPYGVTRTRP